MKYYYGDSIGIRSRLFGLIQIHSYSLNMVNMRHLLYKRIYGGYYCYFRYTLPFTYIHGVTLYVVSIEIRMPKAKWIKRYDKWMEKRARKLPPKVDSGVNFIWQD